MDIPEYFISCDWGTTNFRLRVVNTISLEVVEEIKTNQGVKKVYDQYIAQNELSQFDFFCEYILSQINVLPIEHQKHVIICSGMASSSIGLYELDYVSMPIKVDGKDLEVKKLKYNNHLELLLVSGIKDSQGVMRGEETQAIGFQEQLQPYDEGVLLLPGTHSKHLLYLKGEFVELKSFMTGELFEILSKNSILSNSIIIGNAEHISEKPFLEGVKLGSEGKLSSSLFSIRVNDLFGKSTKIDNYFYLSGLLIGDELAYLKNQNRKIFLAAPYPLSNLYQIALDSLIGSGKYTFLDVKKVEMAVLIGQKKILEYYEH